MTHREGAGECTTHLVRTRRVPRSRDFASLLRRSSTPRPSGCVADAAARGAALWNAPGPPSARLPTFDAGRSRLTQGLFRALQLSRQGPQRLQAAVAAQHAALPAVAGAGCGGVRRPAPRSRRRVDGGACRRLMPQLLEPKGDVQTPAWEGGAGFGPAVRRPAEAALAQQRLVKRRGEAWAVGCLRVCGSNTPRSRDPVPGRLRKWAAPPPRSHLMQVAHLRRQVEHLAAHQVDCSQASGAGAHLPPQHYPLLPETR